MSIFLLKSQKRLLLFLIQKKFSLPRRVWNSSIRKIHPYLPWWGRIEDWSSGVWFPAIHLLQTWVLSQSSLQILTPGREKQDVFISIHALSGSQALAISYLQPQLTDSVHQTIPSWVPVPGTGLGAGKKETKIIPHSDLRWCRNHNICTQEPFINHLRH